MLKGLLVKGLKKVLGLLERGASVESVTNNITDTNVNITTGNNNNDRVSRQTKEVKITVKTIDTMSEDEKKEYISNSCEDITAQIFAKGYKAIPEILEEYEDEVVKQFVMYQLIALGQWDREKDELECCKAELIEMAINNNQEQFKLRMIEQGKANVTKAQSDLIAKLSGQIREKNSNFVTPVALDKFSASDVIEQLNKRLGVKPNAPKTMVGGITEGQLNTITKLTKKLNKTVDMPTTVIDASKLIESLIKECGDTGIGKASDKQVEYVKRLLKLNNKRWTAKREEQYRNMTIQEISATISELKATLPEDNSPTEGQLRFIKDLSRQLNIPVPSDLSSIDKVQASKIISKLRKEYFYIQCRANGTMLTKEDIAKMNDVQIKNMLEHFKLEKKTNNYTKHQEDVV